MQNGSSRRRTALRMIAPPAETMMPITRIEILIAPGTNAPQTRILDVTTHQISHSGIASSGARSSHHQPSSRAVSVHVGVQNGMSVGSTLSWLGDASGSGGRIGIGCGD